MGRTVLFILTSFFVFPGKISEHERLYLACDGGRTIAVLGTISGKGISSTCIGCASAENFAGQQCNGKPSCTVAAGNNVNGDLFKYLLIQYSCLSPGSALPTGSSINLLGGSLVG